MRLAFHGFLLLVASNTLFSTKVNASSQEIVTLRSDLWCPYACSVGEKPGYMVEVAMAVFEPKGYKIDYQTLPWPRAVREVSEGKFIGLVGAAKVDAPTLIYTEEVLGNNKSCFYGLKGKVKWRYAGLESLPGLYFSAIKDYTYGDPVDSYIKNRVLKGKVEVTAGDNALQANIKKVIGKRMDAVIENENVIAMYFKDNSVKEEFENLGCVEGDQVYIGFDSKNSNAKKYSDLLNAGIIELRKSGGLKTILDKYGVKDWKK